MSIRFKFRSSVQFDSVNIENRPSISVRDLRSKIVHQKNINVTQDLDLVFSDALTGQEYREENHQIPSGSSVIIKRVPAKSGHPADLAPGDAVKKFIVEEKNVVGAVECRKQNTEMDDFDDFGVDLCPVPDVTLIDYKDFDKHYHTIGEKTKIIVSRTLDQPLSKCQQLEASEISDANPKGIKGSTPISLPKPKVVAMEDRVDDPNLQSLQNIDLPSELKCSLCHTYFKEAVMIPCCQHSFCHKCISSVLVANARCPRCLSTRCSLEDLLPNVSLRRAIDHFLESQIIFSGSDNVLLRYAPDGESGIQAKDVSCALSVHQREPDFPHSPSATVMGSNQTVAEFINGSHSRNKASVFGSGSGVNHLGVGKSLKSVTLSEKVKCIVGERQGYVQPVDCRSSPLDFESGAEFQGENQPVNIPQVNIHDEGISTIKKRGTGANTTGGDRSFIGTGRFKKGNRACYFCGSLDHLVRDCAAASAPHPMFQTGAVPGYFSPYWNAPPLAHPRPFASLYGNPSMMPFNANIVPGTPFAVSPYGASLYGGSTIPSGYLRMGSMAPSAGAVAERPVSHLEFLDLLEREKNWKFSNDNLGREQSYYGEEDNLEKSYYSNEKRRSQPRRGREESTSYSEDSCTQRSQRSHHDKQFDDDVHSGHKNYEKSSRSSHGSRNRRRRCPERSSSTADQMSNSSELHRKEKHRHHHGSSKKYKEGREQCGNDISPSYHQNLTREVKRKRIDFEERRDSSKYHGHTETGLEPSTSHDQIKCRTLKDSSRSSRHSGHEKHLNKEPSDDRWHMVSGTDGDCRKDHGHHKQKRVH